MDSFSAAFHTAERKLRGTVEEDDFSTAYRKAEQSLADSKTAPLAASGKAGRRLSSKQTEGIQTPSFAFTHSSGSFAAEKTAPRRDNHDVSHAVRAPAAQDFTHSSGKFDAGGERDAQRKITNRAFRTADAFLPQDPGVYIRSPAAYDTYTKLYDTAASEEAKLHALGGRSARELPQTLAENFAAGTLGAVRSAVNEAGYIAQRSAEAQQEETAEMWRRMGREDRAREAEAVRAAIAPDGYESWADFGQSYLQTAAQHAAGHGKAGQIAADVAQGAGGMIPAMASNWIAPGSGLGVLFAQASGSATEEALEKGASKENAVLYGTAVGTVEALTEKLTGGIPALGAGALDEAAEGFVKRALQSEPAQHAAIRLVKSLGEGAEEFASAFADAWMYRQLVDSRDKRWKEVAHDAWYSALVGALTATALNLPADAARDLRPKSLAVTVADETARRVEGESHFSIADAIAPEYTKKNKDSLDNRTEIWAQETTKPEPPAYHYTGTVRHIVEVASSFPESFQDLLLNGWVENSNEMEKKHGFHRLEEKETGLRIRFDEGQTGEPGFKGKNHYHVFNPDATGNSDLYLSDTGEPVNKKGKRSHILPGRGET